MTRKVLHFLFELFYRIWCHKIDSCDKYSSCASWLLERSDCGSTVCNACQLGESSVGMNVNWTWTRRHFSSGELEPRRRSVHGSWFKFKFNINEPFNLTGANPAYTKSCINQCRWHSQASIDSGWSLFLLSMIILPLLLKHLSHSADIAGIDRGGQARLAWLSSSNRRPPCD